MMQAPRLIAITDLSQLDPVTLLARLRGLAEAATPGSLALLLRDHAATGRQRLGLGQEMASLARSTSQALWVADRIDLALLLEADGLHLGEGSVPASAARKLWGIGRWLSRAWHRAELSNAAELEGVNALLLSPVLSERKGRPPLGLHALARCSQAAALRESVLVYALGGVTSDNAASCLAAGASGVAAIGAALASDPSALLGALGIAR
ncbi:MAG TPA: thiamine phosphate synthase [Polyangiaceae bacterium]|nr:thiamine phosphate synthase [Polyangiaceae bacterium]